MQGIDFFFFFNRCRTSPTFSSILSSLDPMELFPLSLARSSEVDIRQANNKSGGLDLWFDSKRLCVLSAK